MSSGTIGKTIDGQPNPGQAFQEESKPQQKKGLKNPPKVSLDYEQGLKQ